MPFALIALAGQGYLRGVSDLRTPLVIVVVANVANVVLNVVFIYGFDWGLAGSAWATVVAQAGMGAAFVAACCARPPARGGRAGGDAAARQDRGRDLRAHRGPLRLLPGGRRGARARRRRLAGAHQVAFQLFVFLALVLDAIAIAGQVIVGRALGAGDAEGATGRRAG